MEESVSSSQEQLEETSRCSNVQTPSDVISRQSCSEKDGDKSENILDAQENEDITDIPEETRGTTDAKDNLQGKSTDVSSLISNNDSSQNNLNDEPYQESMNIDASFQSNVKNINPAPNVEDMITDEPIDPLATSASNGVTELQKDSQNIEHNTISNGDSNHELDASFVNNNTAIHVRDEVEGNRNTVIVDAMNKDQKWKTDSVYQKDLSSLKLLCDYGSDSGDDNNVEDKEKSNSGTCEKLKEVSSSNDVQVISTIATTQSYRKPENESETDDSDEDSSEEESSSSSSSSEETSSSSEESSAHDCVIIKEKKRPINVPKTKGELGLDDLPPIEDLRISVPESLCVEIGKVLSIVDSLVVVQSIKGCPTLDLDSVLFLDHGQSALGQVFDVLGKVGEACYCVRFNSKDHALEKGVTVGMPVYYAPQTEHSKFVFLADLMKMKGSDASWEHNNEPPDKFRDFSDDDEERKAKKGNKPAVREVEADETQPQAKRFTKRGGRGRGWGGGGGGGGTSGGSSSFSVFTPRGDAPGNSQSPKKSATTPWGTPYNPRFQQPPTAGENFQRFPGPQPLLRPTAFTSQPPPIRLYQNPCATLPQPPSSPWAVPPPVVSHNEQYAFRDSSPLSFASPQPSPSPGLPPFQPSPRGLTGPPSEVFGAPPRGFGHPTGPFGSNSFGAPSGNMVNPGMFERPPPATNQFGQNVAFGGFGSGTFGCVRPQQFGCLFRPKTNGAPSGMIRSGAPSGMIRSGAPSGMIRIGAPSGMIRSGAPNGAGMGQFERPPFFQNNNDQIRPQQGWMG